MSTNTHGGITFLHYDVKEHNRLITLSIHTVHFEIKMKFKDKFQDFRITNLETFLKNELSKLDELVVSLLFTENNQDVEKCIDTTKFPLFYMQYNRFGHGDINELTLFGFPQCAVLKEFKKKMKETRLNSFKFRYAFHDKNVYNSSLMVLQRDNNVVVNENVVNKIDSKPCVLKKWTQPVYNEKTCVDAFNKFVTSIKFRHGNVLHTHNRLTIIEDRVITTFTDLLLSIVNDDAKRDVLKRNLDIAIMIAPWFVMHFNVASLKDISKYNDDTIRRFGFYDNLSNNIQIHIVISLNKKIQFAKTSEDVNHAIVKADETFNIISRMRKSDPRIQLTEFLLKHLEKLGINNDDVSSAFVDNLLYTPEGVATLTKWWQSPMFHNDLNFLSESPRDTLDPYINTTTNEFCMKGTTCACAINHTFEVPKCVNINDIVCFWCETPLRRIT